MLHGAQRDLFELEFCIPSECADRLAAGAADIGLVPSYELTRQDLEIIPGVGIACRGAVRSILLVLRKAPAAIRTLAADASSRTSVQLARLVLAHHYGVTPEIVCHPPDLNAMLGKADAALLIGDAALRVNPAELPWQTMDLGTEWLEMTGQPMVFAVWAGRPGCITKETAEAFRASCRFGRAHLPEIVDRESLARGFTRELVREYLEQQIVHELGDEEFQGMLTFLQCAGNSTFPTCVASK
jgi:predicted solute-binding protein